MGKETISSQELSDYTHVNSTQIRRDLSGFGKFGKRGVGYNVDSLVGADPSHPADRRSAQHRVVRCRTPRQGDRLVRHLRRPRLQRGGDLRRRHAQGRLEGRRSDRCATSPTSAGSSRRRASSSACSPCPTVAAQPLADELVAAGVRIIFNYSDALLAGPARGDGAHLEPRSRPAARVVLLPVMSSIDLDLAEAAFVAAVDGTRRHRGGVRVLDPASLELVPRFEELATTAQDDDVLRGAIAGELISSEIEIRSGPGDDLHDAIARQRDVRSAAVRPRDGARSSRSGRPVRTRGPTTASSATSTPSTTGASSTGLQYVARRNNTFALHVHVGVQGADRAVRTCDRLRAVLPVLLAAGANSPFLEAQDTGLHSARTPDLHQVVPALWCARCLRVLGRLPRVPGVASGDELDRREHAGLVVGPPAPGVRDRRGADLAMPRRRRRSPRLWSPLIVACVLQAARDEADGVPFTARSFETARGEHVARDPVRNGWAHDRPRPRGGGAGAGGARSAVLVDGAGAGRAAHRPRAARAQRRAAPACGARAGARICGRSTLRRRGRDPQHLRTDRRSQPDDRVTFRPPGAGGQTREPTEEELHAAYEAEMKRLRIEDVLVQTVVSLLNLGARKAGLVPGSGGRARPRLRCSWRSRGHARCCPLVEPAARPERRARCATRCRSCRSPTHSSRPSGGAPRRRPLRPLRRAVKPLRSLLKRANRRPGRPSGSGRLWVPGQ